VQEVLGFVAPLLLYRIVPLLPICQRVPTVVTRNKPSEDLLKMCSEISLHVTNCFLILPHSSVAFACEPGRSILNFPSAGMDVPLGETWSRRPYTGRDPTLYHNIALLPDSGVTAHMVAEVDRERGHIRFNFACARCETTLNCMRIARLWHK
jgi:hypothetical protein